jgi:antitoxin component YwqK of YwqJK toxin-antitoxin module
MEVIAAAVQAPTEEPAAACYICYEEESADNPYIDPSPCACTGSIKLHIACFRELKSRTQTCSICKSPFGDVDFIISCDFVEKASGHRYVGKRLAISGKFAGPLTVYYPSGAVYKTKPYTNNGVLHGCYTELYECGQIKEVGHYRRGSLQGPYMTYYESGIVRSMTEYENNARHGSSIEYFEDGGVRNRCKYMNGQQTGEYVEFYDFGDYLCKCSYENGQLHGPSTYYYPSGNIEKIVQYMYGEIHGTTKYYYDGGMPEKDVSYVHGMVVDDTVYDEQGAVKYIRDYRTGSVIEFKNKKKGRSRKN